MEVEFHSQVFEIWNLQLELKEFKFQILLQLELNEKAERRRCARNERFARDVQDKRRAIMCNGEEFR